MNEETGVSPVLGSRQAGRGRRVLHHATNFPFDSSRSAKISGMRARSKPKKSTPAEGKMVRGRKTKNKTEPHTAAELVIITGMSGSGKASALKAFEDLGYYCVDNLPVELIPRFAELALQSGEIPRTALVVDVREGTQLEKLPAILKSLKRMIPTRVIYLEASDPVLLRRFSETRRPHPLGTNSPVNASLKAER